MTTTETTTPTVTTSIFIHDAGSLTPDGMEHGEKVMLRFRSNQFAVPVTFVDTPDRLRSLAKAMLRVLDGEDEPRTTARCVHCRRSLVFRALTSRDEAAPSILRVGEAAWADDGIDGIPFFCTGGENDLHAPAQP